MAGSQDTLPAEPHSTIGQLEGRRFSFYPAILGIDHNEWTLGDSTWSEVQVRNCETGADFWIPKRELGGVSSSDSPVLILGLRRELEFKAGGIFPHRRVVTEIPSTPAARRGVPDPAPEPGQRNLSVADARVVQLLALAVGVALVLSVLIFLGLTGRLHNPLDRWFRADTSTADQRYIGLSAADSSFSVVARLGRADLEQWISGAEDEIQFQALHYPQRRYIVILMGGSRSDMRYLGTLHGPTRQVLDSAELRSGGDTGPMMRNLPDF